MDYEIASHFLSTHPASHFLNGLVAARAPPGERLALRNREFARHRRGAETQRRRLATAAELFEVLERDFGIELSGLPGLEQRLEALP